MTGLARCLDSFDQNYSNVLRSARPVDNLDVAGSARALC